jgi:hypothetical protein
VVWLIGHSREGKKSWNFLASSSETEKNDKNKIKNCVEQVMLNIITCIKYNPTHLRIWCSERYGIQKLW